VFKEFNLAKMGVEEVIKFSLGMNTDSKLAILIYKF